VFPAVNQGVRLSRDVRRGIKEYNMIIMALVLIIVGFFFVMIFNLPAPPTIVTFPLHIKGLGTSHEVTVYARIIGDNVQVVTMMMYGNSLSKQDMISTGYMEGKGWNKLCKMAREAATNNSPIEESRWAK
jgi:hypothetical protein